MIARQTLIIVLVTGLATLVLGPHVSAWMHGALGWQRAYEFKLSDAFSSWSDLRVPRAVESLVQPEPIICSDGRSVFEYDVEDKGVSGLRYWISAEEAFIENKLVQEALRKHYSQGAMAFLTHCLSFSLMADACGRHIRGAIVITVDRLRNEYSGEMREIGEVSRKVMRDYVCGVVLKRS